MSILSSRLSVIESYLRGIKSANSHHHITCDRQHRPDPRRAAAGGQGRQYGRSFRRFQPDHLRKQRPWDLSRKDDDRDRYHLHADLVQPILYSFPQGEFPDGGRLTTRSPKNGSRAAAGGAVSPGGPDSKGPGGTPDGQVGLYTGKRMPVLLILTKSYLTGKFAAKVRPALLYPGEYDTSAEVVESGRHAILRG